MGGLFSIIRILLRPVGFIGAGFFIAFVGLSWIIQQNRHEPVLSAPELPELGHLETVEGVISGVSLPKDKLAVDAIAIEVKRNSGISLTLNVPDSILKKIAYQELKGNPITLRVDEHERVYEVRSGNQILYGYDEAVARHRADVERHSDKIEQALAASERLRVYGFVLLLIGVVQFGAGIVWWRRRGVP